MRTQRRGARLVVEHGALGQGWTLLVLAALGVPVLFWVAGSATASWTGSTALDDTRPRAAAEALILLLASALLLRLAWRALRSGLGASGLLGPPALQRAVFDADAGAAALRWRHRGRRWTEKMPLSAIEAVRITGDGPGAYRVEAALPGYVATLAGPVRPGPATRLFAELSDLLAAASPATLVTDERSEAEREALPLPAASAPA